MLRGLILMVDLCTYISVREIVVKLSIFGHTGIPKGQGVEGGRFGI